MKKLTTFLAAMMFAGATMAEVTVIVHPSNADAMDAGAISRIFLGKAKSFPGGGAAKPLNLSDGNAGYSEFNEKLLKKSDSQLKAYWSKLVFTGKGSPPDQVGSDAEMMSKVASDPSAIGYITGAADGSVKVVGKF